MVDFIALAQQCAPDVAPATLAAIVKTESAFDPNSIGVNGGRRLVRQPANKAEAIVTAKWLLDNGYNIDLGLGQVNSSNLARVNLSVEDAFDPCKNLAASAAILTANYRSAKRTEPNDQRALHVAFSMYNTGSPVNGFRNGYVARVLTNAGVGVVNTIPSVKPIPLAGGSTSPAARKRSSTGTVASGLKQQGGAPSSGVIFPDAQPTTGGIMVYE